MRSTSRRGRTSRAGRMRCRVQGRPAASTESAEASCATSGRPRPRARRCNSNFDDNGCESGPASPRFIAGRSPPVRVRLLLHLHVDRRRPGAPLSGGAARSMAQGRALSAPRRSRERAEHTRSTAAGGRRTVDARWGNAATGPREGAIANSTGLRLRLQPDARPPPGAGLRGSGGAGRSSVSPSPSVLPRDDRPGRRASARHVVCDLRPSPERPRDAQAGRNRRERPLPSHRRLLGALLLSASRRLEPRMIGLPGPQR